VACRALLSCDTPTSSTVILGAVIGGGPAEPEEPVNEPSPGVREQGGGSDESGRVPAEIREVSFSVSLRGYDRRAVDAYVTRVNSLISELEAARSPEAAVKQALEQLAQQTSGILQHVGETAEEIAVSARQQAEDTTAGARNEAEQIVAKASTDADELARRSKAEAETLLAQARTEAGEHRQRAHEEVSARQEEAEERMRRLQTDTESVREVRRKLLDDLREIAARVEAATNEADERLPPRKRRKSAPTAGPDTHTEAKTDTTRVTAEDGGAQ
jgi:DivIVA domain-containing protein